MPFHGKKNDAIAVTKILAGPVGFEPTTIDLEGRRAIQSAPRTPSAKHILKPINISLDHNGITLNICEFN